MSLPEAPASACSLAGWRAYEGVLCGRITSLNHRVDLPAVHAWITDNTVSSSTSG